MRIVVSTFVTLDGVMEAPDKWSFPFWSDQTASFKYEELFASDALLLGRVTYEGFAAAWPTMTDEQGFSDRMNGLPKYVVSNSLQKADWNNSTIIKGDIVAEITKLKQQEGRDILVGGSATLIQTLAQNKLVDAYRLLVYPIVRGSGKRLFQDGTSANLQLIEATAFDKGVLALRYEPISD